MPRPRGTPGATRALATSSLGEWIRSVRLSQGVSQRALAERSGVSRSYLCDIERGRGAQPSVATLDKLAAALGASRADLLRAAGVLDPVGDPRAREGERRLLALYRDLSASGRSAVERFARFTHREEHQWLQPALIELPDSDGAEALGSTPRQGGPTLFDQVPGAGSFHSHGGTGAGPARLRPPRLDAPELPGGA